MSGRSRVFKSVRLCRHVTFEGMYAKSFRVRFNRFFKRFYFQLKELQNENLNFLVVSSVNLYNMLSCLYGQHSSIKILIKNINISLLKGFQNITVFAPLCEVLSPLNHIPFFSFRYYSLTLSGELRLKLIAVLWKPYIVSWHFHFSSSSKSDCTHKYKY
jgi:hypothetical protein